MREEEIKKMIENSAEDVTVPAALEPENMMKRLEWLDVDETNAADAKDSKNEKEGPGNRKKVFRLWHYGTVAAALLAVIVLASINTGRPGGTIPPEGVAAGTPESAAVIENGAADAAKEEEAEIQTVAGNYQVDSYDEVYDRLQEVVKEQQAMYETPKRGPFESLLDSLLGRTYKYSYGPVYEDSIMVEESMDMEMGTGSAIQNGAAAELPAAAGTGTEAAKDFSDTNVQVEGVDEGDIVKTDGTYIYVASGNSGKVRIIRPAGSEMELVGEITESSVYDNSNGISEFYINGTDLTVIRSGYGLQNGRSGEWRASTSIETYDLSKPAEPRLTGTVIQDGYYSNSRRNGDYVYVFTNYYGDLYASKRDIDKYIPMVNGETIPADCIYLPERISNPEYLVVTSVDMKMPKEPVQTKGIMASGQHYYVSTDHIYIASYQYDYRANQYDYTELLKFSYRDGRISFMAHGNVNGYLNNQFSMDEYQGNLRLVSTLSRNSGVTTNSLYVLNEELKVIGEIEDLAPDEQIYSARFMGDVGYFVTFRNMDPLFSVDLSNPEKPKILGELKITGFSEYLHPYEDNLLLGIGREINPDNGNYEGLKLSMFDTSDLKDVTETQKMVEEAYQHSTAWDNHKSVLISPKRSLIGFTVEDYDYDKREWGCSYVIYSYDKRDGFVQKLSFELDINNDYYMTRGLYIGDWLYIVENNRINAFSLADFNHQGELNIER